MSFGKLKSARKAKELHSYVKPDGSSPSGADGFVNSLNTTPAYAGAEHNEQLAGSSTNTESDQLQHTSLHSAETPRVDEASYESLAEASQEKRPHVNPDTSTMSGKAPDRPPERNAETTTPVSLNDCHTSLPASLEIRESSRHGRGIYTNAALQAGELPDAFIMHNEPLTTLIAGTVVMSIVPHVSVLSTPYLDQHCSACAAPAPETGLKRCPKCKAVYYCDKVRTQLVNQHGDTNQYGSLVGVPK